LAVAVEDMGWCGEIRVAIMFDAVGGGVLEFDYVVEVVGDVLLALVGLGWRSVSKEVVRGGWLDIWWRRRGGRGCSGWVVEYLFGNAAIVEYLLEV
jgi:hypothetical protein